MAADPTQKRVRELKASGHLSEALGVLEDALARRPGDLALKASLADLLVRMRRPGAARQIIDEVLAIDPDHGPALTALGELHWTAGRLEDSLEAYRLAGRAGGPGPYLALRQAQVLARMGDLPGALGMVEAGLALDSDHVGLGVERVALLARSGRREHAGAHLASLASRHPGDRRVRRLALRMRARDRPAAELARELDGALGTSAGRSDADLWGLRARAAWDAGDFATAATAYLEQRRIDSTSAFALKQAGFAFRRAGDQVRAIACLEEAFLEDPTDVYVRRCLIALVRRHRGHERVVALLDRAIARHPEVRALLGIRRREVGASEVAAAIDTDPQTTAR